jgi:hypothetical protein
MTEPDKLQIRQLLGHLTATQLWGLLGALVALLAGTFSFGFSAATYSVNLESVRAQIELQKQVDAQQRQLAEVNQKLTQYEADAKSQVSEMAVLALKAKFLDHFLRYSIAKEKGGDDLQRATSLFVGFVHRLWKAQEDAAVKLATETQVRTEQERVRVNKPVVTRPFPQKTPPEFVTRERTIRETVIKTVTFPDGGTYVIPHDVGAAVHKRE